MAGPRVASAEEFPLVYTRVPSANVKSAAEVMQRVVLGFSHYPIATRPPAAARKLPHFRSKTPLFARVTVGASSFILAFDQSGRLQRDYDVLYLDANGNGDLTDDKVHQWQPQPPGKDFSSVILRPLTLFGGGFTDISLTASIGGASRPYSLRCVLTLPETLAGPVKTMQRQCFIFNSGDYRWEGQARFGDRLMKVAVQDSDSNGRFDDLYRMFEHLRGGDGLLLDEDGNGRFDLKKGEWHFLGQFVQWEGRFYQARVVQHDGSLFLNVEAAPLGTIKCNYNDFALSLIRANGLTIEAEGKDGTLQVPLEDYQLQAWSAFKTDAAGHRWQAYKEIDFNRPALSVKADAPVMMQLPLAFSAQVKVEKRVTGGTYSDNGKPENFYAYDFELQFKSDKDDEIDFFKDGHLPAWLLIKTGDRTIERLDGNKDQLRGWTAPEGVKGPLRAVLEPIEAPFLITIGPDVALDVAASKVRKRR